MFVSSIKLKGRAEKRLEILQTISGLLDQIRQIKGCLSVTSYQDLYDNNVFCLINEWETQGDMDAYLQSRLFAVLLGIRSILAENPEVKIMIEDCTYNCGERETVRVH